MTWGIVLLIAVYLLGRLDSGSSRFLLFIKHPRFVDRFDTMLREPSNEPSEPFYQRNGTVYHSLITTLRTVYGKDFGVLALGQGGVVLVDLHEAFSIPQETTWEELSEKFPHLTGTIAILQEWAVLHLFRELSNRTDLLQEYKQRAKKNGEAWYTHFESYEKWRAENAPKE